MPDESSAVSLPDLFSEEELQSIQDAFSLVADVASVITKLDGTPITRTSNFTRFCKMIRNTDSGCARCLHSDAIIGRLNFAGPNLQPCLSSGLLDAGVGIHVGDKHIANWLIGQVRDGTQSKETVTNYARLIGVDEDELEAAFLEVPFMPREKFHRIAESLFTFANELSQRSYEKYQQLRMHQHVAQLQMDRHEALMKVVAGVAHEINTPLGAISSCSATIESVGREIVAQMLSLKYGSSGVQRSCADWLLEISSVASVSNTGLRSCHLRNIEEVLTRLDCLDPSKTADELVNIGFPDDLGALMKLTMVTGYEEIASQVSKISDLVKASRIVKEATEMAARFVVALQNAHQ